jgi:hypothetical protein
MQHLELPVDFKKVRSSMEEVGVLPGEAALEIFEERRQSMHESTDLRSTRAQDDDRRIGKAAFETRPSNS